MRRVPSSYDGLVFYTKTVFGFVGRDGRFRYARYRLVGEKSDGGLHEVGEHDAWDRAHQWLQNPHPDETRDRNYLERHTRETLESGGKLRYTLQVQLREPPPDERVQSEWGSSTVPWDPDQFPHHDLAHVVIDEALPYEEMQRTWFSIGNHPESLPVPKARSIDDPHSLNHLREAGIWARRTRLLSYRLGMPPPFPDSRAAKDWVGIPPMLYPPGTQPQPEVLEAQVPVAPGELQEVTLPRPRSSFGPIRGAVVVESDRDGAGDQPRL